MASTFYRIHKAGESLETLLSPTRPDGWTAGSGDEDGVPQPHGVSACCSVEDLASYVREYGMAVRHGDRLIELVGSLSHDQDRDHYAVRVIVESYEVLGDAKTELAKVSS